jgi:nucleoside-diphosphate-sugar epimerase
MRVAVTGPSGFTGRFIADSLARRGMECVPLSADLTDRLAVEAEVEGASFDRLIHLAAMAFVDAADWTPFYSVNQLGTFYLLEAVARHHPGARCILASSAQVYGSGAKDLVTENSATSPGNHYAISKLAMEHGAALWRNTLEIVTARPFNYTGLGQGIEYLVPKIVDHFLRRADSIELGNLFVRRDFGDVRSVAEAYVGLAIAKSPPPLVNIATGILHSIDDILAILTEISGHRISVTVNPRFVRSNDVPVLGGDASRLHAALPEWSPHPLRQTLTWMYTGIA